MTSGIIRVLADRARLDPLAWLHRREAHAIAAELRRAGHDVRLDTAARDGKLLLRLSDPEMLEAVAVLDGRPYAGPGRAALERCYDKYEATRAAAAAGFDCPPTALASEAAAVPPPRVLKRRRGSDSIGLRLLGGREVPPALRDDAHIVQTLVRGSELTVALFRGKAGLPLRLELPPGTPYTFWRKYAWPPRKAACDDGEAREAAMRIGRLLGVDWAARVDFIREAGTGRLVFLECDAAPLVGARSAWAASFAAAGVPRATQLEWLLDCPQP